VIAHKEHYKWNLEDFGIPKLEKKSDIAVGLKDDLRYYKMKSEVGFSTEALREMVESYFAGTLEYIEKVCKGG
jgi:hypothetical protein